MALATGVINYQNQTWAFSMAPSHHDQHASCHHLGVYQSPFDINIQTHVIHT
jgi:hypothetical protein